MKILMKNWKKYVCKLPGREEEQKMNREYKNGFAKDDFLHFMYDEFPTVYDNSHSRELLENIVDFCTEDNSTHLHEVFFNLERLIPEIKGNELIDFFDIKEVNQEIIEAIKNIEALSNDVVKDEEEIEMEM